MATPVSVAFADVNIVAKDAKSGGAISNFRWVINVDNSHANPSVAPPATYSPVVATGNQDNASGIDPGTFPNAATASDRGYLVTVYANDGVGSQNDPDYKICGTQFPGNHSGEVVVECQPNPLPLATLKVRVFQDNASVNGEWDQVFEVAPPNVGQFHVTLSDRIGEVTTDWFGNPICTQYQDLNSPAGFGPEDVGPDGPTPIPGTGGFCIPNSDPNSSEYGVATIPNLGPNKYEVEVIPPDGAGWIQTSTIEGTLHNDAWVQEGAQGFATEPEAGLFSQVFFGFVKECSFGNASDTCPTNNTRGNGTIRGVVKTNTLDTTEGGFVAGNPVPNAYIALNNIGGNDEQVWTGRANPTSGAFTIPNVPAGQYLMTIWDKPLDHIIQFRRVSVNDRQTVDIGTLAIPRWFGTIKGSAYIDANENGIRDPGEVGLKGQDLDTRFKDGTIQYATFSNNNGNYLFPEVFELEHFAIAEVGYGRFKNTGAAAYKTDNLGNPLNYPNGFINQDLGLAGLLQAEFTPAGQTVHIDWGKKAFGPNENGGIVGIVFNATTRNELDARLQANEDYEPGIPGVTVNLYAAKLDSSGNPMYDPVTSEIVKDHLANVYVTDSYTDPHTQTDCLFTPSFGRTDPSQIQPSNLFPDCLELPSLLDQVKPGVFDGGYAFEDNCSATNGPAVADSDGDADGDGIKNRFDPDLLGNPEQSQCVTLPAGLWVVEVVPRPGYQVVKEEDINVFSGDQFVPAVPPPPCVGPLHTVDVAGISPEGPNPVYNPDFAATPEVLAPTGFGSPYEGQQKPLCNERLIDLKNGFNANSDFFIFTATPVPGRIRGTLLDDLNLELDPNSPMYAEKRPIRYTPVGIRDFTGKLITTVYSDENGYFEVLLPSTGTYNCPLPAGPCPGMYFVVGNDPGDPLNPDSKFNPNYQTLPLVFEVWPGLTTYADVAIIPNTSFVQNPGSQFETPPVCNIAETTPNIQSVDPPYGGVGTPFTINGSGFGSSGSAKLNGTTLTVNSWAPDAITVTVPMGTTPGRYQLLVTNASGATSPSGITFHVLGTGYNPTLHQVTSSTELQDALDAAVDAVNGDLILVHPGLYFGHFIMHSNVKLQGYGPGATILDGRFVFGSTIDHAGFDAKVQTITFNGAPDVPWGQVLTVLAADGQFHSGFNAQIDGFKIQFGRNERGNGTSPNQGGGIYVHGYARYLELSNNLFQSNFGSRGGAILLGLPTSYHGIADAENDWIRIDYNQVLNNGGKVESGAIGIFNGAENYEIDHNFICGNYAAEYGGGISQRGLWRVPKPTDNPLDPGGRIHDNKILFNYAFDEGGGILIGGEPKKGPQGPGTGVSDGSGPVTVERNLIQGNVSNDDGGGIRLLNPVQWKVRIVNNMVVDNLATDTGGGISLDDALSVEVVNNTVARNVTTATAEDADRTSCHPPANGTCPHGAGLVSEQHSAALAALLKANSKPSYCAGPDVNCTSSFSDPVLFNNIFWKNEAFYLDGQQVILGYTEPSAGYIDLEVLQPGKHLNALFSDCTAFTPDCPQQPASKGNISADPLFVQEMSLSFDVLAFGGDPSFITVILKSQPGDPQGNYHLQGGSPAINRGAAAAGSAAAPSTDFDGDPRPIGPAWDMGADERP